MHSLGFLFREEQNDSVSLAAALVLRHGIVITFIGNNKLKFFSLKVNEVVYARRYD